MNECSWTVGGLEFRMLMEHVGRDRLPFPLQFQVTADSAADYHRQRQDAADSMLAQFDDDLRVATNIIRDPQLRIELIGHTRTVGSAPTKLRAHAAIRHEVATVLVQQPGVDDSSGGPVAVHLVESHRAVRMILDVLPPAEPGRSARIDVRPSEGGTSLFQSVSQNSADKQLETLFSHPRSSAGEIHVCAGPAADSRPDNDPTGVQWADVPGDGRYMIRHSSMITVTAASLLDLGDEIRKLANEKNANHPAR
ncbi:ESX secretion-associated protein EspG [Rhodococcus sp. G-MC3]|uniref:ESX secretion-associated protein EspG n=1 Tax=Rhodococcus sp. G-MC3 TaxID=3046209 RepID=UPI0024BA97CF|nr:ESX secretion-associated protein EspG [Rhodococcus sp. G-MC3]MDJ0393621.1 ESX secretion-associated protein EspG [Rhodococcus sp. G-MC3]